MFLEGEEIVAFMPFNQADEKWVDLNPKDEKHIQDHVNQSFLGGRCYITNRRMVIMTTKPSANIKEELEGDEEHGYVKTFTATVSDSVEFYSIPLPSFLPGYSFTAHHKSLAVSLTTRKPEEEMSCWRLLCCCYRKGRICNLPDDQGFWCG